MVKLVFCLHRLELMTVEEFSAYWLTEHGPLVRSLADTLKIRRYEQLHPQPGSAAEALRAVRGATEVFDGVAELWFDNEEDIGAAAATPEGRRAARTLLEDEKTFIDLPRSPIWLFREEVVIP